MIDWTYRNDGEVLRVEFCRPSTGTVAHVELSSEPILDELMVCETFDEFAIVLEFYYSIRGMLDSTDWYFNPFACKWVWPSCDEQRKNGEVNDE